MNLASKLLAKVPEDRIGYGKNFKAIKDHAAFEDITYWDKFNPQMFLNDLPKTDDNLDILDFISTSGDYNDSDFDESEKLPQDQQDLFKDF